MAYEDALAHVIRREIHQQLNYRLGPLAEKLATTSQVATAALAGPGSMSSPTGGTDDSGAGGEMATTGVDYGVHPPREGVLFPTVDARLDNLDESVGLRFPGHVHDGIGTPRIPVTSVTVPASLTGAGAPMTLDQYLVARAQTSGVKLRSVTGQITFASFPVRPFARSSVDDEVEDYARLAFRFPEGTFTQIHGASVSVLNLRHKGDGQALNPAGFSWRSRAIQPFCSTPEPQLLVIEFSLRWSHHALPNHSETQACQEILADVGALVFGS